MIATTPANAEIIGCNVVDKCANQLIIEVAASPSAAVSFKLCFIN